MEAQALAELLADLPMLDRKALQLRFGIIDDRPRSYAALAEGLEISTRQSRKPVAEGIEQVRLHSRCGPRASTRMTKRCRSAVRPVGRDRDRHRCSRWAPPH